MQPLKLTLTGFRGIHAGMGLDTFTLDLAEYADAKLVAIVAPNGRGKTTVLDNLQPFRLMPSKIRGANYSPEAFSYFDHLVSPGDASKTLEWEHLGVQYRTLIEWKLREKTQSTAAYLQFREVGFDDWAPVVLKDGTSSDGKAKTYDKCVEGILGSPRLYFTAAFSAQGRSQLSSYAQGDIKGLMSEVLQLNALQELGDKAAGVNKGLKAALLDRRTEADQLAGFRLQANTMRTTIAEHTRQLNEIALPSITRQHNLVDIEKLAIADMLREKQDAEQIRVRRFEIIQKRETATLDDVSARNAIDGDVSQANRQLSETVVRLSGDQRRLNDRVTREQQRQQNAEQLLNQREQIELAKADIPVMRDNVKRAGEFLANAQAVLNEARQTRAAMQQLDQGLSGMADAGRRLREQETDLTNRCALTKDVPCQGTDLQGRCKLLTDAVAAEAKLPTVTADIVAKTEEFKTEKTRRDAMAITVATIPALEQAVRSAETDATTASQQLTACELLASKADGLEGAQAIVAETLEAIKEVDELLTENAKAIADANDWHAGRMQELQTRRTQAETTHKASLAQLQVELDRIPLPGDDTALEAAQQRLAAAEKAEQEARAHADELRGSISQNQGRLSAIEERVANYDQVAADINHLEAELVHWSSLQRALGRDGILALSIDDAGPTLAGLANDLLLSCYGPRFSVRIDTQETVKSSGVQKETFDVIVFDSESDTSKSVADMSGGERIWINEALTRAIALYQAQASGQTFHTLFSDESDGALDPEKKGQFVRMKRRVLELGGYGREYFISHSPDVWPLADAVVHL